MLKKSLLAITLILLSNQLFAENNKLYNQYLGEVAKTEAYLSKCIPDEDMSTQCYLDAENKYDKIITNIRETYSSKVDAKLWQAINLGYLNRKKNCKAQYLDAGTTQVFYPYIDCLHSTNHSLVITTIELHLK